MEETEAKKQSKFSLIELLMIIMLVGIIFTLTIPYHNDKMRKEKLDEAIKNIQIIAYEDIAFKNNEETGDYYAFDMGMLNVENKLETINGDYMFDYSVTDSTVVATTNSNFGKEGAKIVYYLPDGPWQLGDNKISESVFNESWLP